MSAAEQELRAAIDVLSKSQRARFSKRLDGARRISDPQARDRIFEKILGDLKRESAGAEQRRSSIPDQFEYPDLPIIDKRPRQPGRDRRW